ncbi:MAG: TatD family hydrolase [Methanobacteriaceae archaeon]|nr:TatD family hydrolase [Methanobacteriaceae archaeon]MDP2836802.1 TatD family hydrolase [Methanobacteriaceae archaeon]MDP3033962.1 TatD family hydrolase [Methanobacteriaceae archaeon]MDP3484297.1 TatD family hydrolase [Methanobacteriaceae archaeon]MDP3622760.1 TatD family hydrolase [Methanobacteriaceae archaeon]
MIDAHIHADTRPYEDFEKMAISGIDKAITCAHDPLRMTTSEVVLDHFHRLVSNDVKRANENGLKLYVALGLHPRSISKNHEIIIQALPNLLQNNLMVAIGEIGLEKTSSQEINVFIEQLKIADDLKAKVIVHTPRTNKKEVTKTTKKIILENINPKLVIIDHIDFDIVDDLIDQDFTLGITVQPLKMAPQDAVNLLKEYGTDKFVLNSDISSSPSDPLSVPKTVHQMRLADFKEKDIAKVSEKNASAFFNI